MIMEDKDSVLYFYHIANKINRRKYRSLGIKNEKLLEKLVHFDAKYFMYMFRHRVGFDKAIKDLNDELPDDF